MLLSEVVFNRELVKTPHPMYSRFWLVSWFVELTEKHIAALWVFPNKEECEYCTQSKETYRIRDLLMDKYSGNYFRPFKSDNGVYMAAILTPSYVDDFGTTLSVVGASFTEKSALAAAKKAIEDKGHVYSPRFIYTVSIVPRDPSIFRLDPDEDIDAITEGIGSQALQFADYVGSTVKKEKVRNDFMKLGKSLFKDGWTFYNDNGGPRFAKDDDPENAPGNGWAISFPQAHDSHLNSGIVSCLWSGGKINHKQEWELCHYRYHESAEGINERWGLETFKQFLFKAARPLRK